MGTAGSLEAAPVLFRHYVPGKPFSDFVALFWYWRGQPQYGRERILPMGTVELVINLASPRTSESGISGPHSTAFTIERTVQDELLGIHFKVGGVFPFLRFPAGELHNEHMSLADMCGESKAAELLSCLHESRTVDQKFNRLEKWLQSLARRPLKRHPAVSFALREFQRDPGLLKSAKVSEVVGYSQRHFIELFRNEVGLTPKLLCRIQRFQRVIQSIHSRDSVDWLEVALSCGYFDQSHFIHDFTAFTGLTPREYLGLRTDSPNHVQHRD